MNVIERAGIAVMTAVTALVILPSVGASAASTTARVGSMRRASDYSIRAVYVVPAGGHRRRNRREQIAASVGVMRAWFKNQTGGSTLRFDTTRKGAVAVDYVRLSETDDSIRAAGADAQTQLQADVLARNGHDDPNKVYLLFYEGISDTYCGASPRPPSQTGHMPALFLQGLPSAPFPCATVPLAGVGASPGYWEFIEAHEVLHALGFVADCAPHQTLNGHVGDSTADLMYAGPQPWQLPPTLDVGHDDYFHHPVNGCPDLANSVFLDPQPSEGQTPPGW